MTAAALEFYMSGGHVMVVYNLKTMSLEEMCMLDGARKLLQICDAVRREFPKENTCDNYSCARRRNKETDCGYTGIVGDFVKKHLRKYDKTLDVVVSAGTDYVKFNLEE